MLVSLATAQKECYSKIRQTKYTRRAGGKLIGNRLKLGRQANALSLQELADALEEVGYKITRAALSKYERGDTVPGSAFLSVLAQVLDLDESFFFREEWPGFQIRLFQSREMIPKQESELMAYLQMNLEQRLYIDKLLDIHPPAFTYTQITPSPHRYQEEVEALTMRLREQWGNRDQVIASVCGLLEGSGWYVFEIPALFGAGTVSGIEVSSGRPFLAFSQSETVDDLRFNILKEVAGVYLRCDDSALFDEMCCCFSRAMLFPRCRVEAEFSGYKEAPAYWTLALLKRRYGLSKIQIRMRLRDLELFGLSKPNSSAKTAERVQARKLMDSKSEPLYFYENPANFKIRVIEARHQGLITQREAAYMLPRQYTQISTWDE